MMGYQPLRLDKCAHCCGMGWTGEHDPSDPHVDGECGYTCPIQVPCDHCIGTGYEISDPLKVLRMALDELSNCYNVTDYPGGGNSSQGRAIPVIEASLKMASRK